MRHGFIAATGSQAGLLAELERHAGEFALGEPLRTPFDVYDDEDGVMTAEGWRLAIGERDGHAFVLDTTIMLSNSPDMLQAMSSRLGVVVGCGAETFSGMYWLTAARDGELLRFVFVDNAGLTQGMVVGEPLSSELVYPIESYLDGGGLFAAMSALGLDPRPWLKAGPAQALSYDSDRSPAKGQIEQIRSEHTGRYARPENEWLSEITAVVRDKPERQ